ncbi:MAG: cobaltochelatase subunit CobT [Alphaproteobacteria bacterium]|nr:cobaltochelatase subunit CobT [Alphaproteobacteria bacterium]
MSTRDSETEFLEAQAQVAQAISGKQELHVMVGLNRVSDEPLALRESILIAKLNHAVPEEMTRHMRAQVDLAALALKHHNSTMHTKSRPADIRAGAVFDALELIRLEAIGGEAMQGVRHNLAERHRMHCDLQGYARMQGREELALPDVVAMIAREAMTGQKPPESIEKLVAMWRPWVEEKVLPQLGELAALKHDQKRFSKLVQTMLRELEFMGSMATGAGESDPTSSEQLQDMEGYGEQEDETDEEPMMSLKSSRRSSDPEDGEDGTMESATDADQDTEEEFDARDKTPNATPNRAEFAPWADIPTYHAFSTSHDETVEADMLAPHDELQRLFEQLMLKVKQYHTVTSRLATRLQRLLLAQQARQWIYEQEDGMIDNARLASIVARPDMREIYKIEKDTDFRDTVVSLLIDNSGSMRGRPITIAALSADILARTLERCGVKVEILGFTTRDWKGGFVRKEWVEAGRPENPGRLNDLRHIIYKSANQRLQRARRNLGLMLKDGILKENIDGEAILWAYERLRTRPEQRKILMVISDGAPVDDSTLSANSSSYLDLHLREVIKRIERENAVEMLAIGIGHDVTRYYGRAITIHDVEQLGDTMLKEITRLFVKEDSRSTRKSQRKRAA